MNKRSLNWNIILLAFMVQSCNVFSTGDQLKIENELFSKTIYHNGDRPGGIVISYVSKTKGEEQKTVNQMPWFEFVINKELVTSGQSLWLFRSHSVRKMGNGGIEHTIVFEGAGRPVDGLQVKLFQQIFPGSTLMREKLELSSESGSFQLNKIDGNLHFVFPAYSIKNSSDNKVSLTEIRMASWEKKNITFGDKKKGNHMYYPDIIEHVVSDEGIAVKGPMTIVSNGEISWFAAYEHASQDNLKGMLDEQKLGEGNRINDAMQGTKGVFDFPVSGEDFKFLQVKAEAKKSAFDISVEVNRGGYFDGEVIDSAHPYSSVWTATGFYKGKDPEMGKSMIRNYLFNQICEKPASRKPEFYYNTWGMQRQDRTKPLRDILTYERIFEEIDYAAQLGVDIFVLDDGWENTQGEWFPDERRLKDGLAPIKKYLDKYGIKMGLWYSPMGIDSTTQRYREHPEWVIKDSENKPIMAQWNHPAFDFVGGFFDLFIEDCKKAVDQGCLFMKWDAINTFYSSLPGLEHGTEDHSKEELRARYEYLLPIYVVRAMEILTEYEPELVIEIDLTEARRVMVGLAPLSQGKLFWMNNGASWYNDYSTFRTKSMRTIANEFAGIVPLELFTYANYPHNMAGAMKYNVNNSLLAGHGFWGNLKLMSAEDRKWVGEQVKMAKQVLPYLVNVNPKVEGAVGSSPEIYSLVDIEAAAGQIILFSEEPSRKKIEQEMNTENLLAVVNHPYAVSDNILKLDMEIEKEGTNAVFILPNTEQSGITITASSSSVLDVFHQGKVLNYRAEIPGEQEIVWDKKMGKPLLIKQPGIDLQMEENNDDYLLTITTKRDNAVVEIRGINE